MSPGTDLPEVAELVCRSHFSFLQGASSPEELVERAARLGYSALALTDECSLAGAVRAHEAWRRLRAQGSPLKLLLGSLVKLEAGPQDEPPGPLRLALLAADREGYAQLAALISLGRSRAPKGQYRLHPRDLEDPPGDSGLQAGLPGCLWIWLPEEAGSEGGAVDGPLEDATADGLQAHQTRQAAWLVRTLGADRGGLGRRRLRQGEDLAGMARLEALAAAAGLRTVAVGDVLMHARGRKPLQDTLTAIRLRRTLDDCGRQLAPNAEQHLRPRAVIARLHPPEALAAALALARQADFALDSLDYAYPDELVPPGRTPLEHLRGLTAAGAARRYPGGVPDAVAAQVEREFQLIGAKGYEAFFLTVHDAVDFARRRGILCQGRGSAANSAVCFCLGITEVDPTQASLLFERFISAERDEPPDIDVDFEHERREEVIQHLFAKYGRPRCALAAAVTTFQLRGAVREVGTALGFAADTVDRVVRQLSPWEAPGQLAGRMAEAGLDHAAPRVGRWVQLAEALVGVPRHLSQHSGGLVISRERLSRLVPVEPAAMPGRQVIQWDKDDLESLGLLKVDILALGMLSVLRRALDGLTRWRGPLPDPAGGPPRAWALHDLPREDPATYAMIQRADTVGVFQIESRAQQAMLPRLRPACFYDLVVEVAIVRPGPIQGGMVHPYLRRRQGLEPAHSPDPALDAALARTLGVPIFQEQVMQLCMLAAGFSGGEADQLRRAMAAWRRKGGVQHFQARIVEGMVARGYARAFAEQLFRQIEGFGEYGFPESHAASFAQLAYFSAWLKCHEPAIFLQALLNAQPMGFYTPSQLVQDARRHGVTVRPVDVRHSVWACSLEPLDAGPDEAEAAAVAPVQGPPSPARGRPGPPAVRLGFNRVSGLGQAEAEALVAAREAGGPWRSVDDLARRSGLPAQALRALARADALRGLAGDRHRQAWALARPSTPPLLASADDAPDTAPLALPAPREGQELAADLASLGLSLRRHPLALLRPRLAARGLRTAAALRACTDGQAVWACGLVSLRQAPATARGTLFLSLEDETGSTPVIVWRSLRERQRPVLQTARLLAVAGRWQCREGVGQLVARRLLDLSTWLGALRAPAARDFR